MINLKSVNDFKLLKQDIEFVFNGPQGENVMEFLEVICDWFPLAGDSIVTNAIVARDARRQVLATIKTFINKSPETLQRLGQESF